MCTVHVTSKLSAYSERQNTRLQRTVHGALCREKRDTYSVELKIVPPEIIGQNHHNVRWLRTYISSVLE